MPAATGPTHSRLRGEKLDPFPGAHRDAMYHTGDSELSKKCKKRGSEKRIKEEDAGRVSVFGTASDAQSPSTVCPELVAAPQQSDGEAEIDESYDDHRSVVSLSKT